MKKPPGGNKYITTSGMISSIFWSERNQHGHFDLTQIQNQIEHQTLYIFKAAENDDVWRYLAL